MKENARPHRLILPLGMRVLVTVIKDQDRTDAAMDAVVQDCHRRIQDADRRLDCFAVGADMEFEL